MVRGGAGRGAGGVRRVRCVGRVRRVLACGPGRIRRFRRPGRARRVGRLRRGLAERVLEFLLVQARRVEGVAAAPVRERQPGRLADVVHRHFGAAVPRGERDRRARGHQVGAHAVDTEPPAHSADPAQLRVGQHDVRQPGAGGGHGGGELAGAGLEARGETGRVGLIGQPAADDLGALVRVPAGRDLHGEPEPVEQLRPQLALFRVHRADEQEAGRVPDRHPLPLDVADPERGRVQQQVDQMVVQQVHLVDVQQAAVRRGEHARLVRGDPLGQRALDVQRADQAILGRADGQLGERGGPGPMRRAGRVRAVRAGWVGLGGITGEPAALDDLDGGQQRAETADDRRLRRSFLTADEDTADGRGDRVEQQRELQVRHADDGGEGIQRCVGAAVRRLPLVTGRYVTGRHARVCPSRVCAPVAGSAGGQSLLAPGSTLALAFPSRR